MAERHQFGLLAHPPRHLFFTGKGGVGKTSVACAVALALADAGKTVLLVSTDPAPTSTRCSGSRLGDRPTPVPGAPGLSAMNIDPDAAAEAYRGARAGPDERRDASRSATRCASSSRAPAPRRSPPSTSSRACSPATRPGYDHIVFDTAPTGHTLRLLSLPKAWTGFLDGNDRGASCLGPHSGLKMQEERFNAALAVARPMPARPRSSW